MIYFRPILSFLLLSTRGLLISRNTLIAENLALRSQLALFDQQILAKKRPRPMPKVERLIGVLRRELLDHIIPLDERHHERLLWEFVEDYYHPVRTHISLNHEPPVIDPGICRSKNHNLPWMPNSTPSRFSAIIP